jgi:hypothetical protein
VSWSSGLTAVSVTGNTVNVIVGTPFTAGHVFCAVATAPGASNQKIVFTISKNGGGSIGNCQIQGSSVANSATLTTPTSFSAGDYVTITISTNQTPNVSPATVAITP